MTVENVRKICLALPEVTEDVKWGNDLCFCIAGKMFAAMDLNPPHSLGFKCTPDEFAELVERPASCRPRTWRAICGCWRNGSAKRSTGASWNGC